MIKFASKQVNGWNNRHLNQLKVCEALRTRMRNGFTLTAEERNFYDEIQSLIKVYNTGKA